MNNAKMYQQILWHISLLANYSATYVDKHPNREISQGLYIVGVLL